MDNNTSFLRHRGQEPAIPLPPLVDSPSLPIAPPDDQTPIYPGPDESQIPSLPIAPDNQIPAYPGNMGDGSVSYPGLCRIRFLFAAVNYDPVNISIGPRRLATRLAYGNLSCYSLVLDGFRTFTVTLSDSPRTILLRKTVPLRAGETLTLALINTFDGVDLLQIPDSICDNRSRGMACFRAVNLSPNSGALDISLTDGRVVYSDLRYKEVAPCKQARPGRYHVLVSSTLDYVPEEDIETLTGMSASPASDLSEEALLNFSTTLRAGVLYTVYLIGRVAGTPALSTLIAENR